MRQANGAADGPVGGDVVAKVCLGAIWGDSLFSSSFFFLSRG